MGLWPREAIRKNTGFTTAVTPCISSHQELARCKKLGRWFRPSTTTRDFDDRPVKAIAAVPGNIMDGGANTLCSWCRAIDLSPVLFREDHPDCWYDGGYLKESYSDFTLGSLNSLFDRASICSVCKMLCETLEEFMDADDLEQKRHDRSGVYFCSLSWSEHARASIRANISYFQPPVEAMFRMDIDIGYQRNFGATRRTATVELRNIFQPAPWPVPQLKAGGERSQFWKTLRNGRLRSPICEPEILRTWLSKCESNHSMCWWTGRKPSLRLRLFDIRFRCVRQFQISSDNTVRYVALSYVWGSQAQRLTLSRANHKVLSKKGAINLDVISRTISDAAIVVDMLGERYLWVDALCILQDDQDDLAEQIPVMGQIYARSLVTIMAAASIDSNSGLPGVSTQARSAQRISKPLNGGVLLRTCRPKDILRLEPKWEDVSSSKQKDYLKNSKWDTRGWTFQEKVLSRRCLFFMQEQVYWECQCASWCEETCLETDSEYRFSWEIPSLNFFSDREFPVGKKMAGEDVIWAFSRLIEEYTSRTLTYKEDTYRAFSGLVHILEDLTGARFLQGLHVSEFSRSLCWHNGESSSLRSGNDFPTWSWLAWTGRSALTSSGPQNHIGLIDCYRVCSNEFGEQELVPISHDLRQMNRLDTPSMRDLATNVRSQLRDDFHIVFWAEAALLDVRGDRSHTDPEPNHSKNEHKHIHYVYPSGHGRTGVQEFIRIRIEAYDEFADRDHSRKLELLMISWKDGIARRESEAFFDVHEWAKAKPQRKLIVMG